jgi:hypothetical protein
MEHPFVDSTTLQGQRRIREYVLGWLERLDYAGKLDRCWPAEALGSRIWARILSEFRAAYKGPVVNNGPLAEVIAATMVEDYFAAYAERRPSRYCVSGPLPDTDFRRCVLDFIHDLEEFEPECLPPLPEAAAVAFWQEIRERPQRWGYRASNGPLIDDESRAHQVALEAIVEYYTMRSQLADGPGALA